MVSEFSPDGREQAASELEQAYDITEDLWNAGESDDGFGFQEAQRVAPDPSPEAREEFQRFLDAVMEKEERETDEKNWIFLNEKRNARAAEARTSRSNILSSDNGTSCQRSFNNKTTSSPGKMILCLKEENVRLQREKDEVQLMYARLQGAHGQLRCVDNCHMWNLRTHDFDC